MFFCKDIWQKRQFGRALIRLWDLVNVQFLALLSFADDCTRMIVQDPLLLVLLPDQPRHHTIVLHGKAKVLVMIFRRLIRLNLCTFLFLVHDAPRALHDGIEPHHRHHEREELRRLRIGRAEFLAFPPGGKIQPCFPQGWRLHQIFSVIKNMARIPRAAFCCMHQRYPPDLHDAALVVPARFLLGGYSPKDARIPVSIFFFLILN